MKVLNFILFLFFIAYFQGNAQHHIYIDATLKAEINTISIRQKIIFKNQSDVPLHEIYVNDWANSFSAKTTPLAKRFAENYKSSFHFEKDKKRGHTTIHSIHNEYSEKLDWSREKEADIVKIKLEKTLQPGKSFTLEIIYDIVPPNDKFTRYGINNAGDYKLRYWYLSPAVFDGTWHYYSNKDLGDLYASPSTFEVTFKTPIYFSLISDLDLVSEKIENKTKTTQLIGDNRMHLHIQLVKKSNFTTILTNKVAVETNRTQKKLNSPQKALIIDRVVQFLDTNLGPYPFKKMVISEVDYKKNPVYGLNLLPDFISPFPSSFEYDIEMFKIISRTYLENSLAINPRKEYWLLGAFQIYLMTEYVDTYYPDMKLLGNLTNYWLVSLFHASELEFNDQYYFLYMNMARKNLQQRLTMPKDSLLKFNKDLANDYHAGNGFRYLSDYIGKEAINKSILQFFTSNTLTQTKAISFQEILKQNTSLPTNWFFENYINKRNSINFRLKNLKKLGDSLQVTIVNKQKHSMPISIYGINKKELIYKKWIAPIDSFTTVTIPAKDVRKIALNYEGIVPEVNQRDNYKKVKGLFNKPFQIRLFKDVEDPRYNQLFVMPEYSYNVYDGLSFGTKIYNNTVLRKNFYFKLKPLYALKSKTIVGSASIIYKKMPENGNLYFYRVGVSGNYFSYNDGLFYKRFSPFATLGFRNSKDLRNNKKHFINLRNVTVDKDTNPNKPLESPNYSVFDISYVYSNPNLINHYRAVVDYQIASKFSKLSTTLKYRKLFLNNRQIDIRIFAGVFLKNKTEATDNYFSFALDRPTDYLFDYNYYGRSDDTGFFSQQLIIAEGGFKSQLEPAFSNTWMATANISTNIWRWIHVYGDIGFVNNKNLGTKTVYDSGLRLSLVEDYFEVYFPVYSNLGWEITQANYAERIRFIITLDIQTLFGLFSRKWY